VYAKYPRYTIDLRDKTAAVFEKLTPQMPYKICRTLPDISWYEHQAGTVEV
jgi:hypothetical protein